MYALIEKQKEILTGEFIFAEVSGRFRVTEGTEEPTQEAPVKITNTGSEPTSEYAENVPTFTVSHQFDELKANKTEETIGNVTIESRITSKATLINIDEMQSTTSNFEDALSPKDETIRKGMGCSLACRNNLICPYNKISRSNHHIYWTWIEAAFLAFKSYHHYCIATKSTKVSMISNI